VQLRGCCAGGLRGVPLGLSQFLDRRRQGNEIRDECDGCKRAVSADVPQQRH
jgi:hypothetical protein